MMTDPIADLLTRVRNANDARHDTVEVPVSKGVIADKEARNLGLGGEVICYIW